MFLPSSNIQSEQRPNEPLNRTGLSLSLTDEFVRRIKDELIGALVGLQTALQDTVVPGITLAELIGRREAKNLLVQPVVERVPAKFNDGLEGEVQTLNTVLLDDTVELANADNCTSGENTGVLLDLEAVFLNESINFHSGNHPGYHLSPEFGIGGNPTPELVLSGEQFGLLLLVESNEHLASQGLVAQLPLNGQGVLTVENEEPTSIPAPIVEPEVHQFNINPIGVIVLEDFPHGFVTDSTLVVVVNVDETHRHIEDKPALASPLHFPATILKDGIDGDFSGGLRSQTEIILLHSDDVVGVAVHDGVVNHVHVVVGSHFLTSSRNIIASTLPKDFMESRLIFSVDSRKLR